MPKPPDVRRRLAVVAALSALTVTGLTGCGGDDSSSPEPQDPTTSAAASDTPVESETATDEPTGTPTGEPTEPSPSTDISAGDSLTADEFADVYEAAIEQATTADITIATSGTTALNGEGQIDFSENPPEIAATLEAAAFGGEADVRLVDGTFYLKLPQLGPKFLRFEADDPSNPFGALFSSSLDPSSLVDVLRQGVTEATLVGEEDGFDHYRVSVGSDAILAQYPAELRDTAASQLPDDVVYDMYVDGEGLLREVRFDLGAAGVTTQTYDDWGTDVDIVAPPPGQVQAIPGG